MDLTTLITLTGASGFFASRAFVPAFFTAFLIRYGHLMPFLGEQEFFQITGREPTWFTNNFTILALGILALIEVGATKVPEAQEVLDGIHKYAKTGMAALAALGILGSGDIDFIENTISQAGTLDMVLAAIVAGGVYGLNLLRSGFMEVLIMADPDDDLGLRNLISWFEDVWSSAGIFLLILYPLLILAVLGILIGFVYLARKWAEHREDAARKPCPSCGEPVYGSALACQACHAQMPDPRDVGFLGQTVDRPAGDRPAHALRLVSKRRCSSCATRVKERRLPQSCPACGHEILQEPARQEAYLAAVRQRLPKVLGITFLMSLIPAVGVIPGIIYYRIQLIAPLRTYIPASTGFLLKWVIRLIFLLLITVQLVPGVGGFMVPAMALISYVLYSGFFRRMVRSRKAAP